jgi:hypothetical protein
MTENNACRKYLINYVGWSASAGDDEMGHYIRIKKYIRAIMAFNLAATHKARVFFSIFVFLIFISSN